MSPKPVVKMVCVSVKNCASCPYSWWKDDPDPMGGNGDRMCKKLDRAVNSNNYHSGIDPDCPLPIA